MLPGRPRSGQVRHQPSAAGETRVRSGQTSAECCWGDQGQVRSDISRVLPGRPGSGQQSAGGYQVQVRSDIRRVLPEETRVRSDQTSAECCRGDQGQVSNQPGRPGSGQIRYQTPDAYYTRYYTYIITYTRVLTRSRRSTDGSGLGCMECIIVLIAPSKF